MAETAIEWTERSWNPIVGCTLVSPGCTNCYAMAMAARIERMGVAPHYAGRTKATKAGAVWTGSMAQAPDHALLEPLRRRKPTTWFVNSMGDLFHEDVPDAWIDRVFAVMALAPQHTFQVLTKRAARMHSYLGALAGTHSDGWPKNEAHYRTWQQMGLVDQSGLGCKPPAWPLPNVWLGISAEDQRRADERIPELLATPAAVRFVSAEPLLGPIDFTYLRADSILTLDALTGWHADCEGAVEGVIDNRDPKLDWVIVGGESGPDARPMHPDWARHIRDQCAAAGTAFFFKQWGEWQPREWCRDGGTHALNRHPEATFQKIQSHPDSIERVGAGPDWVAMAQVGKKRAGRLLDGALHNAMPSCSGSPRASTPSPDAGARP